MNTLAVDYCIGESSHPAPKPPSAEFFPNCPVSLFFHDWNGWRGNPVIAKVIVWDPMPDGAYRGQSITFAYNGPSAMALFFPEHTIWIWCERFA